MCVCVCVCVCKHIHTLTNLTDAWHCVLISNAVQCNRVI